MAREVRKSKIQDKESGEEGPEKIRSVKWGNNLGDGEALEWGG